MVINIKQKKIKKIIDYVITFFGWLFLIAFLFNMIRLFKISVSFQFYSLNLGNANAIVLFTFVTLLISSITLIWWSGFNKRKYGPLRRRKFPADTENKELAEVFHMDENQISQYQDQKYVEIQ